MDHAVVLIVIGLATLAVGGEFLVQGAVSLAKRIGVSPLLVGLTLVGFGTSTPELVTSVNAAVVGSPGIAIGNIVGSNIANILLILGLSGLLMPLAVSFGAVWRDGLIMVLAAGALIWVSYKLPFDSQVGTWFLGALIVYVLLAWGMESMKDAAPADSDDESQTGNSIGAFGWVLVCLGAIGLLVVGADLLVDGSIILARQSGLSETVIGLTIVAVGTSLPELATSVVAAIRRQGDISAGNILGSNIYNILGVGGVTAFFGPVAIPAHITQVDNWVMLGASVFLVLILVLFNGIGRLAGLILLLAYAAYIRLLLNGDLYGLMPSP